MLRLFKADEVLNDDRGWTFNLAIFRLVFLAGAALPFALDVVRWTEQVMPGLPRDVWAPISFYRYLPLDIVRNVTFAHWVAVGNVLLICLGLLGVFTRWTLGLATIVSLYTLGLMQNQGKVDHFHHVIWFMALLAIGPSAHFLSVDALLSAVRRADRGIVEPRVPRSAALWTLRYTWILLGLLYLIPGLAKLEKTLTAGWGTAENLRAVLWQKWFELRLYEPGFQLPWRADTLPSSVLELAGIGVIVFEVGFIALVLFRPLRPFLALGGLAFHIGNGLFLHIWFSSLLPAYVCLFDWTAMGRAVSKRFTVGSLVVLYDGTCRLCRRTIAILRVVDIFDGLAPVAGASDDPRRRRYPQITDEQLAHDLYAIDGDTFAHGYDAYQWIVARVPLLWPVALLMRCPPISVIGHRVYRRIADSRTCELADHQPLQLSPKAPDGGSPHWLGILLVTFQAGISGLLFTSDLAEKYFPKHHSLSEVLLALSWRRPVWPFDYYPTFAHMPTEEIEIWEARVVLSDGREARISPRSFAAAFGPSAKCWAATQAVSSETNPERHQARSLDLLRSLWRYGLPEVRQTATGVRIYHARYSINPSDIALVGERLIHTFPIEVIR